MKGPGKTIEILLEFGTPQRGNESAEECYTLGRLASILGVNWGLLDKYRKLGLIECVKEGTHYKISQEEVDRLIDMLSLEE